MEREALWRGLVALKYGSTSGDGALIMSRAHTRLVMENHQEGMGSFLRFVSF